MTNRMATGKEMRDFVIKQLKEDIENNSFHDAHIRILINELYPFSWMMFCDKKGLNKKLSIQEASK